MWVSVISDLWFFYHLFEVNLNWDITDFVNQIEDEIVNKNRKNGYLRNPEIHKSFQTKDKRLFILDYWISSDFLGSQWDFFWLGRVNTRESNDS